MNLDWLPWRRGRTVNGNEARDAKAIAEQKLQDARELGERVHRAAGRLERVNRENHIRIKMERAYRGH